MIRKKTPVSDGPLQYPEVTDEDILWTSRLLNLPDTAFTGADGTDPRRQVMKSAATIDVAACPGSGKTTLLVAKLAILANKWTCGTQGLCVLSHTNAARHEIEARLGNTTPGRRLLSYPHFIGTIQRFVDEFLALPWLRSQGVVVKMVDTEICLRRRWNALPQTTRGALENAHHNPSVLSVRTADFSVGEIRWAKGYLGRDKPTYKTIKTLCQKSIAQGYLCYDEMFVFADDLLDKAPHLPQVLRDRFPLLFIDEAQDNSEVQSAILHRIFMAGSRPVVRQRFGDSNQAIYDFLGGEEAATDAFPDDATKTDLPNSHRFGQRIAGFADPLGLIPYGLAGHGPKVPLLSGAIDGQHTIFVFDDDSIGKTLEAYAELLLETFSDEELRKGNFTAVGQIHRGTDDDHKPRHVGHYWPDYDPELTRSDPKPETFVQYIVAGQGKAAAAGEAHLAVDRIAEGILRLAGMAEGENRVRSRRHSHGYVMNLLEECPDVRNHYEDFIATFAVEREMPTEGAWTGRWRSVVREIADAVSGGLLCSTEADDFLKWPDRAGTPTSPASISISRNNIYHYAKGERTVSIRVGSIHSAKGETHTATLVLETYWQGRNDKCNLEYLLPWLIGSSSGGESEGVRQQTRLRVHYVAMTRPTHLLCLAIKRSTLGTNDSVIQKLRGRRGQGWKIKYIDM